MSKKKKQQKQSEHQRMKTEEAQRRNVYVKRLLRLVKDMGFDEAVGYFDRDMLKSLCLCRPMLARMDMSQVSNYDSEDKGYIRQEFYTMMHLHKLRFSDDADDTREMSSVDFFEIWLPLVIYLGAKSDKISEAKNKEKICAVLGGYAERLSDVDSLAPLSEFERLFQRMNREYEIFLLTFLFQFSNPCMNYLWVRDIDYDTRNNRIGREVRFVSLPAQWIWGTDRKGERRKLFRVGFPLVICNDVSWLSVKVPRNPYVYFDTDKEYEVYIQEHAVKRMLERLDGVSRATLNVHMNFCFSMWKADWYKGSLLIPFDLFYQRVGYFFADFTDDRKVVIRTFYFITYDRTPEGEALSSYAGLQAHDKKYLYIDRLSTFLASDFDKKSRMASLFREAGCGHLLDLKELQHSIDRDAEFKSISNEFIEKFFSTLE